MNEIMSSNETLSQPSGTHDNQTQSEKCSILKRRPHLIHTDAYVVGIKMPMRFTEEIALDYIPKHTS